MMYILRNTPIRIKLTIIGILTSCIVLLFASTAFILFEQSSSRQSLIDENADAARLVGYNNTAALTFGDMESAAASLHALGRDKAITMAVIYNKEGKVFASYRNGSAMAAAIPPVMPEGHHFSKQALELTDDIELDGEKIGTIYIQHDLSETNAVQRQYIVIAALVMLLALGVNWLISSRLYRIISGPVFHLSNVMKSVSEHKNYSVRAVKQSDDELGRLIDGFNAMLTRVQAQDEALQEARENLEKRVAERTTELANSLSLLNATLESSTDGIVAIDTSGLKLCANNRVTEMWGKPAGLDETKITQDEIINYFANQTKDPKRYIERLGELHSHPEEDSFDVIELKDGRIFERYTKPQKIDGKSIGTVLNFRDVTERRRAEQELENIHRKLLETSRQAGMAEVASNVLHNVGNVLNSVNVSANLVVENMKRSKVANLSKAADMLREHAEHLAEFMTSDPKGKYLPGYLVQVSEHLLVEHRESIKELDSLRNNIDHIKEIVSMQQSYSKVSGVKEVVNVANLVDDALRMNESALRRHGVNVVREFDEVPTINTEKHKILQILINLVRNAKYACSDSAQEDKRICIRISHDEAAIKISVIDNGVGISHENMTRIFWHGFTTRKDGHGFGLHSGAIAARELGGALRVFSDGLGLGATFTLELPMQSEVAHA